MRESDLYAPVKAYLQRQGYEVKAEVGDCDLLARRGDEPPIVVELKLSFSLALVLQGVERQRLVDDVYLAVPDGKRKGWKQKYREVIRLCRRLGLGLLVVDSEGKPEVVAHLDPGPYQPRKRRDRVNRLLKEFDERVGDPNTGGVTGVKRVTAYRQNALRCVLCLCEESPLKASVVAARTGVPKAANIMRDDHYGWFERARRGFYQLTPNGEKALAQWQAVVDLLREADGAKQDQVTKNAQ